MTHNYHTDLVIKIDFVLLLASILLTIIIILYSAAREYRDRRRRRGLLNIKKNVYEMALSGREDLCIPAASGASAQQFLDVATNRLREVVFFNSEEQEIFKHCFITPERIAEFERIAKVSGNKWRRIEAILALGYTHAESAVDSLEETLHSKDDDMSYFSVIALGQIRTAKSAKALLEVAKMSSFARYKIAAVLEGFPAQTAEEIIALKTDADPALRVWALNLLSKFRPARFRGEIEDMTGDASADVRAAACYCLGELGGHESKKALLKCLSDDFWLVRANAVMALSKVMGADCLPEIVNLINDGSLSVIESVKNVMALHIEKSLPYVEKIFRGEDGLAKKVATEALEQAGYDPKTLKPVTR